MAQNIHAALQQEIELTREKFQRFLITVPEEALQRPSKEPGRTNAEVLYQISISPLVIPSILKRNFGMQSHLPFPKLVTGSLIPKSHESSIRLHARKSTLWSLAEEYQDNCNQALKMLRSLQKGDFEKTLTITEVDPLLSGPVTVEQLFHYIKSYFSTQRHLIDLDA